MTLPGWMRTALFATAAMNAGAAIVFSPPARGLRALAGLPPGEHPFYLATASMFVLLFGVGYLWLAVTGRADRLFIALAALGKLSFVGLVVALAVGGELPVRAALFGAGDLPFGLLFLKWLFAPEATDAAHALHRARA
jgi:hypothetical protein